MIETEETQLVQSCRFIGLTEEVLDRNGAYTRLVRAGALRDVMAGRPTTARLRIEGEIPFNLQRTERLPWIFPNVTYLEDRAKREYVGRSQGVGIRIARGLYYRTGSFRGHPVETVHRTHVDVGLFGVTNKHLYFTGPRKSLRVRHDKIVAHTPFSDGIGIHRDSQAAKPQIFVTGDGWFTYNLIINAPNVT